MSAEVPPYPQAVEISRVFKSRGVRFLFIGRSGAILLGFPDTTQDASVFVGKSTQNCRAVVAALREMEFSLEAGQQEDIERGEDLVELRHGPFDLDLVFAPDGIETFADAALRSLEVDGIPVCHIDDIIRSQEAAGRVKDRESLPRLKAFRDWWLGQSGE